MLLLAGSFVLAAGLLSIWYPAKTKIYWSPYQKLALSPRTAPSGEVVSISLNTNDSCYQWIVNLSPAFIQSHRYLLGADEPAPVTVRNENGRSPFLIVADHAGNLMPRRLGGLGVSEVECARHIGWDIGIAPVCQLLSDALDATLVRLVLIPAAMRLLGERNWYLPRWLAWLPEVQVEGGPGRHSQTPASG